MQEILFYSSTVNISALIVGGNFPGMHFQHVDANQDL